MTTEKVIELENAEELINELGRITGSLIEKDITYTLLTKISSDILELPFINTYNIGMSIKNEKRYLVFTRELEGNFLEEIKVNACSKNLKYTFDNNSNIFLISGEQGIQVKILIDILK